MHNANQDLNRLRQPNVLLFSANRRCCLGNLGQKPIRCGDLVRPRAKLYLGSQARLVLHGRSVGAMGAI